MDEHGLMFSCITLGIIIVALSPIAILLLIKDSPEQYGLKPHGHEAHISEQAKQFGVIEVDPKAARRSSIYASILIITLIGSGVLSVIQAYMPTLWGSVGFTNFQSAKLFSIMVIVGAPATIIGGIIADRSSSSFFVVYTSILMIISTVLLILFSSSIGMMYTAAILMGIAYPLCSITPSLLMGETYSENTYDKLIGPLQGMTLVSIAFLLPLVGIVYDLLGGFEEAFTGLALLSLVIFIFIGVYIRKRKLAVEQIKKREPVLEN